MVDRKGHQATSPAQMPPRAWKDIVKRTYKRTWDDNVALVSAGVAFYGFFAMLSLLGLIVLVYGFIGDPHAVIVNMRELTAVLPTDVALLIGNQMMIAVKSSESTKGFALLLAALVAIYGGTNGSVSVITALNIAYEEKEKRSFLRFYILAVCMTVGALIAAMMALAATAAVGYIDNLLPQASPVAVLADKLVGYLVLAFVAAFVASILYRFGPSREEAKWIWITPGSAFTATAWLLLTLAFGFYVGNFTDYDASYGSLADVVALLTWMYLCAYAFVFGAELNSEIEHQTAKDSTTGAPKRLGDRGAWAADNVATGDTVQDRPEKQREGDALTSAAPKIAKEKG
jgi:membrane protein